MKLRKFFGSTSRVVLQQVRTELGPDAVIVMNRPTAEGIEITAMAGEEMDTMLAAEPRQLQSEAPRPQAVAAEPGRASSATALEALARLQPQRPKAALEAVAASAPPAGPNAAEKTVMADSLMNELKAMRSAMESQLAQLTWDDTTRRQPLKAKLTRELHAAGFSAQLAREVGKAFPDSCAPARVQHWLAGVLAKNLHCVSDGDDIITRGGVFAVIGPTGVGKTTTIAKLAARCVVKYGAASLALLTTDSYRIGAQDQLRTYAKILGVSVHTIAGEGDLQQTLASLAGRHLVLIDTVGMGQRDQRVNEQAMLLAQGGVARLLVLNAAAQAETLEEALQAYRGSGQLAGCIVSKVDEAGRMGQVLDLLIRHRLLLHFVANGQRVPEDLHLANPSYLIDCALKAAARAVQPASPFALEDGEFDLVMGASAVGSSVLTAQTQKGPLHA